MLFGRDVGNMWWWRRQPHRFLVLAELGRLPFFLFSCFLVLCNVWFMGLGLMAIGDGGVMVVDG